MCSTSWKILVPFNVILVKSEFNDYESMTICHTIRRGSIILLDIFGQTIIDEGNVNHIIIHTCFVVIPSTIRDLI